MSQNIQSVQLKKTISFWALVLFGVGDMLGSGIYALIGKVSGVTGNAIWLAFTVSMIAALLTAFTYAVLGSRYPKAGGSAFIIQRAFHIPQLSYAIGLTVAASGLTSMAVQARAFGGYFSGIMPSLPFSAVVIAFITLLTVINLAGINESSIANIICSLVEASGLFIIIFFGIKYWGSVNYLEFPKSSTGGDFIALMTLQGAMLAFYSFIGFEDMLNISEEVDQPEKIFSKALIVSIIITSVIYIAVSISVVSVIPFSELAASKQPLVDALKKANPGFPIGILSGIALFAIFNTALINFIMGSRMLYGMSRQGLLPSVFNKLLPGRKTPWSAILFLAIMVLFLVFVSDIGDLASSTTLLLLCVFIVMNTALLVLQNRKGEFEEKQKLHPFIPVTGTVICLALIVVRFVFLANSMKSFIIAAGLIICIFLLYLTMKPAKIIEEETN